MKNSGLGCGCSNGGDLSAVPMAPFLTPPAPTASAKYTANPGMTVNPAATRQAVAAGAIVSPDQLWRMYFREGMAFGVAWTASLEQGRTLPAQWRQDLERSAEVINVPVLTSVLGSNRSAFVSGFDFGIRIEMGLRNSFRAPNGRVYTLEFLRAQGTVAANNLFGQTRPAVLPAVATTSATPMTPGVATRASTYDQFMGIARAAIAANLASAAPYALEPIRNGLNQPTGDLRGVGWPFNMYRPAFPPGTTSAIFAAPDFVAQWILFLMGNSGNRTTPISTSVPQEAANRIRSWAQTAIATAAPGVTRGSSTERAAIFLPYLRAIVAAIPSTPWDDFR